MTKNLIKGAALAMFVSVLMPSCASIINGSNHSMQVNSNPAGAAVKITDRKGEVVYQGATPATVTLKNGAGFFKKAKYQLTFSKDGYQDSVVNIEPKVSGWYFGNLLLGGVIGMLIVDPATGAMYHFSQESINETLLPKGNTVGALNIISLDDVPNNLLDKLVKIN